MTRRVSSGVVGCLACLVAVAVAGAPSWAGGQRNNPAEGRWWGLIELHERPQRVSLELRRSAGGVWEGYIDLIRTVDRRVPLRDVELRGDELSFTFVLTGARRMQFRGVIDDGVLEGDVVSDGSTEAGRLRAALEVPRRPRVQEPVGPVPYEVRDVLVEADGVALPGTLTLPSVTPDEGVSGVVLLAAPNALGRDQEGAGHKPFLVLADRLTRAGFAVLRYDDRTMYTAGLGDVEEVFADARAAVRQLRAVPEVRPDRVGVIALGEGALIAMRLLSDRDVELSYAVLLNPPGVRGIDLKPRQIARELLSVGTPVTFSQQYLDREMGALQAVLDNDRVRLRQQLLRLMALRSGDQREEVPDGEARYGFMADLELPRYDNPWYRYYLGTDPAPLLQQARRPVLLLHGLLDQTHIAEDNVPPLQEALKRSDSGYYAVELMPSINHRLQTSNSGARGEVGLLEETVSEGLMRRIIDWIPTAFDR